MKVRTIKNVDDETWKIFKQAAAKKNVKIGTLLRYVAKELEKSELKTLSSYIPKNPILSEAEARELEQRVKEIRKEYGFR